MGPDCSDPWAGFLGEAGWWRGKKRSGEVFFRPAAHISGTAQPLRRKQWCFWQWGKELLFSQGGAQHRCRCVRVLIMQTRLKPGSPIESSRATATFDWQRYWIITGLSDVFLVFPFSRFCHNLTPNWDFCPLSSDHTIDPLKIGYFNIPLTPKTRHYMNPPWATHITL